MRRCRGSLEVQCLFSLTGTLLRSSRTSSPFDRAMPVDVAAAAPPALPQMLSWPLPPGRLMRTPQTLQLPAQASHLCNCRMNPCFEMLRCQKLAVKPAARVESTEHAGLAAT